MRLEETERTRHRRLVHLSRPTPEPGTITVTDLAVVLYQVLVDGLRPASDVRGRSDAWWSRVEAEAGRPAPLPRAAFDRQLFLLGVYATEVGIGLAIEDPLRSQLIDEFIDQGQGLLRLDRRVPSRWRVRRSVEAYCAAEPEGGGSFLHVADIFVDGCLGAAVERDQAVDLAPVLAEVAIDAFYGAAAGTWNAVTSWQVAG